MDYQEIAERVGEENAFILCERYATHQAGLVLMCEPYICDVKHVVGPMKGTILPPTEHEDLPFSVADTSTFLRRMLKIEQEFASGIRKRPAFTE
jgi:hypothetical protein